MEIDPKLNLKKETNRASEIMQSVNRTEFGRDTKASKIGSELHIRYSKIDP